MAEGRAVAETHRRSLKRIVHSNPKASEEVRPSITTAGALMERVVVAVVEKNSALLEVQSTQVTLTVAVD